MAMKTSVALATYNGSRFLAEQLESILGQNHPVDEIVLSDDQSHDETTRIARTLLENQSQVAFRILENVENLGIVRNFENAISACRGDVIFLCDQDDYWLPQKTERLLDAFARNPDTLLAYSDATLVGADRQPLGSTQSSALRVTRRERDLVESGHAFEALIHRNLVTGATAALRRGLFELSRPLPREWVHDEWIALIASSLGPITFIDEPLIEYRQHEGNEIGLRRIGLLERLEMHFNPRGDFCMREAERIRILLERLATLGTRVDPRKLDMLRERIVHFQFRGNLPKAHSSRIGPIARETLSGRYFEHGRGLRSIVRDLFEPL